MEKTSADLNEKVTDKIKSLKESSIEQIDKIQSRAEVAVNEGREQLLEFSSEIKDQASAVKDQTKKGIQENPFTTILGVGFIALVLGYLFGKKR